MVVVAAYVITLACIASNMSTVHLILCVQESERLREEQRASDQQRLERQRLEKELRIAKAWSARTPSTMRYPSALLPLHAVTLYRDVRTASYTSRMHA